MFVVLQTSRNNSRSDPQGLTQLINSLFTPLTEAILAHKGTVDKYMGDSIMAFWNAPLDDADHAANACAAALAMLTSLDGLNELRRGEATKLNKSVHPDQRRHRNQYWQMCCW